MGLEDFETDGSRTKSKKNKDTSPSNAVHIAPGIDIEDVRIPKWITKHNISPYTVSTGSDEETTMYVCNQCNKAGSSFESIVKSDYLKFDDKLWFEKLMELCIEQEPEFNKIASGESESSGVLDEIDESDDDDEEETGGIMSFKS